MKGEDSSQIMEKIKVALKFKSFFERINRYNVRQEKKVLQLNKM